MAEFVKVASVSDIPEGEMEIVEVDAEEVAVAKLYAFQNACTHREGPLGQGILEGEVVECPLHAGQFNVRTGEALQEPPEEPVKPIRSKSTATTSCVVVLSAKIEFGHRSDGRTIRI